MTLQNTLRDVPLTLEQKRLLVEKLRSQFDVDLVCDLLDLSRSSYYYAVEEVDDGVRQS